MAVTNVTASFPDVILPPGATITITLDDVNADVTKLNVFTFSAPHDTSEEPKPVAPLFVYGPNT